MIEMEELGQYSFLVSIAGNSIRSPFFRDVRTTPGTPDGTP